LLEHLILQIGRHILTLAYEHTEQHRTEDFTENVILFVDYIITYFSTHKDSLRLIRRNFTWSMVQHNLEQPENDMLQQQLLEQLLASPASQNHTQQELFNMVYIIVELCGTVCYSSIIEQIPDSIDHMKPLLYTMIRRILNNEPNQANVDL
ncbi:TetR/AcrR family transcriptional regulator, partial [Butyricicoccus sp.]|uniref:TetR/AcrR family transcriptional regulator n=1 Tax=Butyricicoccus sp. TaxID=2049021 RepID=UPI003D7C50A6